MADSACGVGMLSDYHDYWRNGMPVGVGVGGWGVGWGGVGVGGGGGGGGGGGVQINGYRMPQGTTQKS